MWGVSRKEQRYGVSVGGLEERTKVWCECGGSEDRTMVSEVGDLGLLSALSNHKNQFCLHKTFTKCAL